VNKNTAKGTSFETQLERHAHKRGFITAHRPRLKGALDEGDIVGIERQFERATADGQTLYRRHAIIQAKNAKKYELGPWLVETVEQAKNHSEAWRKRVKVLEDNVILTALPILVVKRPGKGEKQAGDHYAIMRFDDVLDLLKEAGYR
jgi:hypothetical protein